MDGQDTNGVNTPEDSEMAECEGEKVVTMMDVLQEQQDFEDDANAVLGASDDKECTYSKGYIKRQAIYACLTCCSDAKTDPSKRAGVCLACSLNCHENHELVELYTKRNFRCDCGNPKFQSNPCQFTPNKTELNEDNSYNQNFSGLYCTCSRPYPDPQSTVEDEMIQCIICEDWLHASHLEAKLPPNDLYAEMICKGCMEKNEFLNDYNGFAVNVLENEEVDVDDSTVKDSTLNEEAEVKVNGLNGSSVDKSENDVKDVIMEETNVEENGVNQAEDRTENIGETTKEKPAEKIALESTENGSEKGDSVETESPTDESTKVEETPKPEQEMRAMSDESKTKDIGPSEAVVTDSAANSSEKAESSEKKSAEASTEDKPQLSETPVNEGEKLEGTSGPAADETNFSEKIENAQGDLSSAEKEQKTNESGSSDDAPLVENKEVIDPAADDDNKEIDAIDKLLAEGTNEEKPEIMETNVDSTAETTSDISHNTEEPEQTAEKKEGENETNKPNTQVEPSKELGDTSTKDVEMNDDSTNEKGTSDTAPSTEPLTNGSSDGKENKRKLSTEDLEETQETSKKPKLDIAACVRPKTGKKKFKGATFWPPHFRQKLCTCSECITMYKDLSVLFLTDLEDTVTAYEDLGKERINGSASTQYEKGLEALSSLDRIQQINALTEYNKMRDKLLDFLKSFKDRKEVVKEEDIKAFFAQMKPKREPDGVYFCR